MKMINYTKEELNDMWIEGNNNGKGYALGTVDMSPAEAAECAGLDNVTEINPEGDVAGELDGEVIVICDSHGPWAVTVA